MREGVLLNRKADLEERITVMIAGTRETLRQTAGAGKDVDHRNRQWSLALWGLDRWASTDGLE